MVGARLEKIEQVWRRVKPYLLGLLVVLVVAGAIWALIYVPKMQVPVCPPGKDGLPPKICFDVENEARKTLAYIMAGVLAIIGIYMGLRRIRALEDQVKVAQEGQITERFTRAIEQLGSERMEVRLGGIYALERIANDSDKDYWPIIETLTAYVRERVPWREDTSHSHEFISSERLDSSIDVDSTASKIEPKPATDIQAVLTILGRRKYCYDHGETQELDLNSTDLRGSDLMGAELAMANLSYSNLEGAHLNGANLKNASLRGGYLKEGSLSFAHLELADLRESCLEGADLGFSYLNLADIREADLRLTDLSFAHLRGADLRSANLEGAVLNGIHLGEGEYFDKIQLERANLKGTTGLTWDELSEVVLDENTILPDYLQEKLTEAKGTGGNKKG
jgi:uncharacterized protein YjbI with pentapeptide repeats